MKRRVEVDNVVQIQFSSLESFFKLWLDYLSPIFNLRNREREVLSLFLKERFELSKIIQDELVLDTMLMSETTKLKIKEQTTLSSTGFHVIVSSLKKKNAIIDKKINPRFIPKIQDDVSNFKLLLYFENISNQRDLPASS